MLFTAYKLNDTWVFQRENLSTLAGPTSFHLLTVRHVILRHVPGKHHVAGEIPLLFRCRECPRISQFTIDTSELSHVPATCTRIRLYIPMIFYIFMYIYDHLRCHLGLNFANDVVIGLRRLAVISEGILHVNISYCGYTDAFTNLCF